MSRRVEEPIQVLGRLAGDPGAPGSHPACSAPASFVWRGRRLAVQACLDEWCEAGRWWEGEGERRFVRVLTAGKGIYELGHDVTEDRWYLYRILD